MNTASMTEQRPQVVRPELIDFMAVCRALSPDQVRQWEMMEGRDFDADAVAADLFRGDGPKWTLIDPSGHPLMIGGFNYLAPGVWQDWLMSTDEVWQRFPRVATRTCRTMIEQLLESGAHRVQAVILADRANVRAWYRLIGYEHEGTLRGYCATGDDVVIYGRVK